MASHTDVLRSALADIDAREAKLQKRHDGVDSEIEKKLAAADRKIAADRHELLAILEQVEQARGAVEHDLTAVANRVRLNVGGLKFETTVQTLTKFPDTYFSVAFSGRHKVTLDAEGFYFIDREGAHFGAIVNWLRYGRLEMPADNDDKRKLMSEVQYYGLAESLPWEARRSFEGEEELFVVDSAVRMTREKVAQLVEEGVKTFFGSHLAGLDLSELAFVEGTDFSNANVMMTKLSRAVLKGALFNNAKLHGADLSHSDLRGANFSHADLRKVVLSGARLDGGNLTRADLNGGALDGASFVGADFTFATAVGANLRGSNLSEAKLASTNMLASDMSEALLTKAQLNGTQLGSAGAGRPDAACLRGAVLTGATLHTAIFTRADLGNSNLTGVTITSCNFSGANLFGSNLTNAKYQASIFKDANFTNATFGDDDLTQLRAAGAYGLPPVA